MVQYNPLLCWSCSEELPDSNDTLEQERQYKERLAAKLRELDIDPDLL